MHQDFPATRDGIKPRAKNQSFLPSFASCQVFSRSNVKSAECVWLPENKIVSSQGIWTLDQTWVQKRYKTQRKSLTVFISQGSYHQATVLRNFIFSHLIRC